MKKWIVNIVAGIIIYAPIAWVSTLFMENTDVAVKWKYIITFTLVMTLAEILLIQPLIKKIKARMAARQEN